jgi:hypothetical protein
MKLYSSNRTLIHSSSFPEGFVAKKKGGTEEFKTTIRNPELKDVIAKITFVDLEKESTLSNVVTTLLNLQKSNTSSTTPSTDDQNSSTDVNEGNEEEQ